MFMLVYPFTFYATNGLEKILEGEVKPEKIFDRFIHIIVAATIITSILFIVLPPNLAVFIDVVEKV